MSGKGYKAAGVGEHTHRAGQQTGLHKLIQLLGNATQVVMQPPCFGVRSNTNCFSRIHNNLLALNMMAGFDNTKGDPKTKKVWLDKNAFILNKKGDVTVTVSPSILWLNVADDQFEDLEDAPSIESLNGNISISDPSIFKGKINQAYLEGFLNATYTEQTSYNENSPANLFRAAMGMNKQGSISSKVSMFMNKYPMEESLLLFGLMEGYGAQMPK